jgi:type IV secretory pathway VirB3-like protein
MEVRCGIPIPLEGIQTMSTALTIISMAALMPLCVIAGIYVGHTLTIKSQQTTNEQSNRNRM